MSFMWSIIGALNSVSSWFYQLYLSCYYAGWPLSSIAGWFYTLSSTFADVSWAFYDFSSWVSDVSSKIGNYLSWSTIWSYILSTVPNLLSIRDWFYNWWGNVVSVVDSWWAATQLTVRAWIDAGNQYFTGVATAWNNFYQSTWPQFIAGFTGLKAAWDGFWTVNFPNLVSFGWLGTWWASQLQDVQALIGSAFTDRAGLWDGWQDVKNSVVSFLSGPLDWLWDKFTDWFLGAE